MVQDARVTYRRRNPYNTRTNYFKKVRTPGNRLVVQYLKKLHLKHRSIPRCAETGTMLRGVKPNRGNYKNKRLTEIQKKRRAVSRAYGGNLCHQAVRLRIIRAFLSEETRIAAKVRKISKIKRAELRNKKKSKSKKKKSKKKTATKSKDKKTVTKSKDKKTTKSTKK
mmetsp:Transcript_10003/g.15203  ORF Transcript_10003/g.15203 Transcript_10003/m.15203 type:complete len:167 (+) Transcript_10003:119-619(+)|eukprot:CAMPEP_0202685068 /NCGR_PEP_ID=MMETSP1385-20130828/728_1 /ASSEMBLY_ACC=CAM_ASM_000861 /TAXON_ID=933848 /ORGANISM="Elphidium margaritaceum" /LENGTH=166 /DNA_ID=CAMNT_0049339315 /DNA_START=102 /DNA_END=602 /DNA_ORIENTATION=-